MNHHSQPTCSSLTEMNELQGDSSKILTNQNQTPFGTILRSFVSQRAKQTKAQSRALDVLMPRYGIDSGLYEAGKTLDFAEIFQRTDADTILEIGFGMGEATAQMAQQSPHLNFLALEVFPAGVGSLLMKIEELHLKNIRIISLDAVQVLQALLTESCLSGVHIYFPDPWPKKRHHKRRLIQPAFIDLLATRVKVGGYVHCATDWDDYAAQMMSVLTQKSQTQADGSQPQWRNRFETDGVKMGDINGFAMRPAHRPVTKYESRALRLKHHIYDLVFERI